MRQLSIGSAGQLAAVLENLRAVNSSYIVAWSADPRPPRVTSDSVSALKARILALDSADRGRGATDVEIGPPLYPIDYNIAWTRLPDVFVKTMGHSNVNGGAISSLSRASALTYAVRRVLFQDGTAWQRSGAAAWPATFE